MANEHTVLEGTIDEINAKLAESQPAEETPAPDVTKPEETPAAETPVPEATTTTEGFDKYKFLSETLGTEFKSDDDLNAWKSTITEKSTKFDDMQKQYEDALNELKSYNPRKHFASDDDYIINQLKIKYPDLNPQIISNVLTSDLTTLDPISLIAYKELVKDPKHEVFANEDQAYNYVCKKLGYDRDIPLSDQDDDVQVAVKAAAKEARGEFQKLKSEVEVPQSIDLVAEKEKQAEVAQANYDKLKPLVERDLKSIQAGLDKIEITEKTKDGKTQVLFSYDLGDFKNSKMVKDTVAQVLEHTARNAREWTPEIAQKVSDAVVADLRKDYLNANIGQITKAYGEKLHKEFMDAKFEKENHTRPLNPDANNPNMTEEQQKLKSVKDKFKSEAGLTGKKTYAP